MNKEKPPRRTLLQWLTALFLSFWGVAALGAIASYLKAPRSPRSGGLDLVKAGDAETLAPGEARLVRHGGSPLYVIRLAGGELAAVSALCTHFRCVLEWDPSGNLTCPCHNGVFNAVGDVISGLPARPLRSYRVEVRRGEILVHL